MIPDALFIRAALEERGHSLEVFAFETLGSTNAWLGAHESIAALCITDHQAAGKGRRGRVWQAVAGNITFSMVQTLPVPTRLVPQLPLVTGIACAEALRSTLGIDVRVKWPNDLLIGDAKLGGLLHESAPKVDAQRVIGGIGVNLVDHTVVTNDDSTRTSLARHEVSASRRDELVVALAARVLDAWQQWVSDGWSGFARRWQDVDALRDRPVRVFNGLPGSGQADSYDGHACGVDESGALQVRTLANELRLVQAGDVSVRARAQGAK